MIKASNIWWTRKARIRREKRLLDSAFHSELILIWYSFCGVAAAIYYLSRGSNTDSSVSGIVWTVFSVLILSASEFVRSQSYRKRAEQLKICYESLHTFYHEIKDQETNKGLSLELQKQFSARYQRILDTCENHDDNDFNEALVSEYLYSKDTSKLDKSPTRSVWFRWILQKAQIAALLSVLYIIPIAAFLILEKGICVS